MLHSSDNVVLVLTFVNGAVLFLMDALPLMRVQWYEAVGPVRKNQSSTRGE